jgi:hypothetical protein
MRYIILGLYVFAIFWLLLSSVNLYINWRTLREIEGEILKKRENRNLEGGDRNYKECEAKP